MKSLLIVFALASTLIATPTFADGSAEQNVKGIISIMASINLCLERYPKQFEIFRGWAKAEKEVIDKVAPQFTQVQRAKEYTNAHDFWAQDKWRNIHLTSCKEYKLSFERKDEARLAEQNNPFK